MPGLTTELPRGASPPPNTSDLDFAHRLSLAERPASEAQPVPVPAAQEQEDEEGEDEGTIVSTALPTELDARSRLVQVRNRRLCYLENNHDTYFSNTDLELADPLLYDKCIRKFQTPAEREAEGKAKGWSGILHADLERAEARMEALRKSNLNPTNGVVDDEEDAVMSKEDGEERWKDAMTRRFLAGNDEDVDYNAIDDNEAYDDAKQMERDVQDAYFDAETPDGGTTDTGVQDF